MPALTEPHDPKASLTGSGVLPPSPEKALLPKLECSPRGRQRHDEKWVKPQPPATTNLSKAQILLIRFYCMGNLTVLWTMVQNTHRIVRLKVRNVKEIFDMQAVTLLVCPADLCRVWGLSPTFSGVWQTLWLSSLMPGSFSPLVLGHSHLS